MAMLAKPNTAITSGGYNRVWSEKCIKFNSSVIEYLRNASSVQFVVLSSPFGQYLDSERSAILDRAADGFIERTATMDVALEGIKRTVNAVRGLGKKIVVIAPPPSADFDIGVCLERLVTDKISFGQFASCKIPINVYQNKWRPVLAFLGELPRVADVGVIRFDDYLCGMEFCKTLDHDTFLYRDSVHLSYAGSKVLAKTIGIKDLIEKSAR
jgi:hypothetical protein